MTDLDALEWDRRLAIPDMSDEPLNRVFDVLPAMIAELRASRKVVEEARHIAETEPWHDADVRDLKAALAELEALR